MTLLVLVCGIITTTNAQVEKTFVKSLAVETTTGKATVATMTLPGKVEMTEWNNNYISVTTNLTITNMSENIVKQLIAVGRYNLVTTLDEDAQTLTVEMPKMAHHVTVKGVDVIENVTFEINVPKGFQVILKTTQPTPNNSTFSAVGQAM